MSTQLRRQWLYYPLVLLFPKSFFIVQHYRWQIKYGNQSIYRANLKSPGTFNEFTLAGKNAKVRDSFGQYVDKFLVKEFVKKTVSKNICINTQFYFNNIEELDLEKLKFPCIFKPTHYSGVVEVWNSKSDIDVGALKKAISILNKLNLYFLTGERQYKNLKPGYIIEDLLTTDDKSDLKDYKFFVFRGKVEVIQVDIDRHTNHTRAFYSRSWENLYFSTFYPTYTGDIVRPESLDEMICIAENLGATFAFVRVDLYYESGQIYFGELTFDHGSGYEPFSKVEMDEYLGSLYKSATY